MPLTTQTTSSLVRNKEFVIRKLHLNGQRKIAFRVLIPYISFRLKRYGGNVRYVEVIGGLLLVVERSEEVAVLFVQGKIETYFLTKTGELSTLCVVSSPIFKLY